MEKKSYTGVFTLAGKKYTCQVVNGVRFVEGKPIEEFLDSLPISEKLELIQVGLKVVKNDNTSPQKVLNEIHQSKNN
jgi:hypothetical protein